MARYVDGYIVPIKKNNVKAYLAMARKASKVWMEHGALEYREAVGDELNVKFGMPFPKLVKNKSGETVFFSWVVYKSRSHRDKVNALVMKDPRIAAMCDPKNTPFDVKRMVYGGFQIMVEG